MHSVWEVFLTALGLGLTSFGGPFVHLARFRKAYVERKGWLDEAAFARLLSLCQLLPGPTSSQLGIAVGRHRAGTAGALAAWAGFTLPSALVLAALAAWWPAVPGAEALTRGLESGTAAVVFWAVWSMAVTLTASWFRRISALAAAGAAVAFPGPFTPLVVLIFAGLAGWIDRRSPVTPAAPAPPAAGRAWPWLTAFGLTALGLAAAAGLAPLVTLAAAFFRAGSLVFGGGHVVLAALAGDLTASGGLPASLVSAGYGAAQLVPGPLFTASAFWGWAWAGPAGALVGTVFLFLPGFLLVMGLAPLADRWLAVPAVARISAGLGAGVTGLLAAVLVQPLGTDLAAHPGLAVTAVVLTLLHGPLKVPGPAVVLLGAAAGLFWS